MQFTASPDLPPHHLRRAAARGQVDAGWLRSAHSFSFGDYHDPAFMGFGALRVINEDVIAGGGGFPPHPHRDMEILTFVLDGALAHRDSLGHQATIRPGDIQRMSAGTGIRHSEFNASATAPVHLLQVWVLPERPGGAPGYAETHVPLAQSRQRFTRVAGRAGGDGAITLQQDMAIYRGGFSAGSHAELPVQAGSLYLQVAAGSVRIGDATLAAGDALALPRLEGALPLESVTDSLLFAFAQPALV